MNVILPAVLAVLVIVGTGYIARKLDWITAEVDKGLLKLLINVLMPCLIFSSVLNNKFITGSDNSYKAPIFGFIIVTSTVFLTWFMSSTIFRFGVFKDPIARRPFAVTTGLQNFGFVCIPILYSLGKEDLLGLLMLHNAGVELAVWTTIQLVFTGNLKLSNFKTLINGPSIAIVLVMTLNFTGLAPHVPDFFVNATTMMGKAAIPLGLMLIGCTLYNCFQGDSFKSITKGEVIQTIISANLVRSVALPLFIIYIILNWLPISTELRTILMMQAAMPAAFFPIVLSRMYDARPEIAITVASTSMLLSFFTIPFWIDYGLKLLGK